MQKHCFFCGATWNLINHHINYNPERTIIVCCSCHSILHNNCDVQKRPKNFSGNSRNLRFIPVEQRVPINFTPYAISLQNNNGKKTASFVAPVIRLGRVTIPKEVRNFLNIKDGDIVKVGGNLINLSKEREKDRKMEVTA